MCANSVIPRYEESLRVRPADKTPLRDRHDEGGDRHDEEYGRHDGVVSSGWR